MAVAYFEPKRKVEIDEVVYVLDRMVSDTEWQLENKGTGKFSIYSLKKLLKLYVDRRLRIMVNESHDQGRYEKQREKTIPALDAMFFESMNEDTAKERTKRERMKTKRYAQLIEDAKVRYAYVNAVDSANLTHLTRESLEPVIAAVWERLGGNTNMPHWNTVYRWCKRYRAGGQDIRALVSRDHIKGNYNRRYDNDLLKIIDQAVRTIFLTRERKTRKDTLYHAIELVRQENLLRPKELQLPLPTESLIIKSIDSIPAFDRAVERRGREYAVREFRSALHEITTSRPLERVEIDHTILDIMIVDDETYLPLGRPTLTVCLDVFTKNILGIYIGFEPPSYSTVAQCMKQAFLPKTDLHEQYPTIIHEWYSYGIPTTIVVDNGMEFHCKSLESFAYNFGITILYTPRKKAWYKPSVERVIGTINRNNAHGNPGTTFANFLEKEDYDAAKNATISLSTFKEIVHKWIVDIYHQTKHSTLGQSPRSAWQQSIKMMPIPLPTDVSELDALIGTVNERTITHKGVEMATLFYNSKELADLRMRIGSNFKATIRNNPCDLGHVYVFEPKTNRPIRVPAVKSNYAEGLSEWQHRICKKYAEEYFDRKDIEALAKAKEEIRQLIIKDMSNKRIKTRSKSKRFMQQGEQNKDHPDPGLNSKNNTPNTHTQLFATTNTPNVDLPEKNIDLTKIDILGKEDEIGITPRKLKVLNNK